MVINKFFNLIDIFIKTHTTLKLGIKLVVAAARAAKLVKLAGFKFL